MDPVRKAVSETMVYNMGVGDLSAFQEMLAAAENGNWTLAAEEMCNSKWYVQVGAESLARQMETRVWQ